MNANKWIKEIIHSPPIIQHDIVSPTLCQLLSVTIGASCNLGTGDNLPLGYHLLLFPTACKESDLSEDGYTREHAPPAPYSRRLWGGGEFTWRRPLIIGDALKQSTKVVHAEIKGSNLYVYLEKVIFKENYENWSLKENRTMIYLEHDLNRKSRDGPVISNLNIFIIEEQVQSARDIIPTPSLLFRYSALTFNAHKIHLDKEYTREVEGFPELLVHGPLTCTLLLDLIQKNTGKWEYPASFSYRAISPLFANRKMKMSIKWLLEQNFCKVYAINADSNTIGMSATFNFSHPSSTLKS